MKRVMIVFISVLLYGCQLQPKIPVSDTLEIALGNKYLSYVSTLNKAYENDTSALFMFLEIDDIYDAAGYDHGFVLLQLMTRYEDKSFADVLRRMPEKGLTNLQQYFEVGIDNNEKCKQQTVNEYPISAGILQVK